MSNDSPFTPSHKRKLIESRRAITDLVNEFDRAEKCGLDCVIYRETIAELDRQLAAIEAEYMKGIKARV